MSNELAKQENKSMSVFDGDQFDHWFGVAQKLANSEMIPRQYKNKPMDILISIDMGKAVGLGMMQSLQSIAVINGFPAMYGDAPLAVCQQHPLFEYIREEPIITSGEISGYKCIVKRRNNDEHISIFTINDAKKAGLWGKTGPWSQYPQRMLQMRARGFALRNTFPDALKGIHIAEEVQDVVIDAEWSPKKTQSERLNSLLTKKGINNNAPKTIDAQVTDNNINAVTHDEDGVLLDDDNQIATQPMQGEANQYLAENGESESINTNSKDEFVPCSSEQLESIELLIHEKQVDKAAQLKCLDHFHVTSFNDLTFKQAQAVVKKLNRME